MASNKPEKVFRIGYVSASVFANDVEGDSQTRTFRSVVVQRSYRNGDDTRFTSSFGLAELPQAIRVLQIAQRYVEERESEVGT